MAKVRIWAVVVCFSSFIAGCGTNNGSGTQESSLQVLWGCYEQRHGTDFSLTHRYLPSREDCEEVCGEIYYGYCQPM